MPGQTDSRYDISRRIAEATMAIMAEHGIAPTPLNYEIWYSFSSQSVPPLRVALEEWLQSNEPFTPALAKELHKKFLDQTPSPQIFAEIGERMGAELERLSQSLEEAGRDTSIYGHTLRGAAGVLGGGDLAGIRSVVENLIVATRHVEQRSRSLEAKLSESNSEVQLLREDIENIRRQSLTDQLTGLANRRAFEDRIIQALDEARSSNAPLCVLMGDIDHFKAFNDTWGHQTGDQVLRLVARCLMENIKGRDTAARYGGEEFSIILPDTELEAAMKLADAIRRSVQSKKVIKRSTGETLGTITMSLGVAMLRPKDSTGGLIERADLALYAAKHSGRNCVRSERDLSASATVNAA